MVALNFTPANRPAKSASANSFAIEPCHPIARSVRGLWIVFFGLASFLGGPVCQGQDAATTMTINLKGAVATALKQNIDVQISTLNVASQQQEKKIARSALLPHASLDASESIERFNLKATFGLQLPDVPPSIGPFQAIHAGPTFQIPVFDLSLLQKYEASGHKLAASRSDAQAIREQIILLAVSEYAAHLRATADVVAAKSRVELATRLLSQAHDLEVDGIATKVDVSRADVRLSVEKQHLVDAQTQEKTTVYALKRILNIPDSTALAFSDDQDFFTTPALGVDDSVESALKQRPDLVALADLVDAARAEHRAAVSSTLPTLNVNGHWDEEGPTPSRMAPGYKYELDFRIPIFTGGRLKAERDEAAIKEHQAALHLADGRNRTVEQVRDSRAELDASLVQVATAKKQVDLAKEELDLSEGRFQNGVTDNIEVIAGQDAVSSADDAYIAALYRYAVARADLARAIGASEAVYNRP
jgi:outer membrane protein